MNDFTSKKWRSITLVVGFFSLLKFAAVSKPTIVAGDFPGYNTMVVKQRDTTTTLLPGPSGANVVWNFSDHRWSDSLHGRHHRTS